jgi:SAM-dependent methyltransferase
MLVQVRSASLRSASDNSCSSFGADRLARIAEIEASHFWFAGRRALVRRLLDRHVEGRSRAALDVGCGTGSFLPILELYADRVVGIDPLGDSESRVIRGDVEDLPFEEASFDLALALDLLEHVDDHAAVRELARVLQPGAWVIVTVPAFPALWSERDKVAAHRRRYRRSELVELLETAGFTVAETAYYQFALFPFIVLSRALGRFRTGTVRLEEEPLPGLNRLLRRVSEAEVRLGAWMRWPWGSTLAVAAQRKPA